MLLYDYFRSSAGYRVRIALGLKGLCIERRPVHLLRDGGAQHGADYRAKSPQGLVPALELDSGAVLTQSLAIIDYLDALHPQPRLVPQDPLLAAKTRAIALAIACDTHPLQNLRVGAYLESEFAASPEAVAAWRRHWISDGLAAVEQMVAPGPFCMGAAPTLADVCLVPQLFAARRFGTPLDHFPRLLAAEAACLRLEAFAAAHPARQSDAE